MNADFIRRQNLYTETAFGNNTEKAFSEGISKTAEMNIKLGVLRPDKKLG